MPALIDNYTAMEFVTETYPKGDNVRYKTEVHRPVSSSTIVSIYSETGINQRILNLLDEYSKLNDNWDEDDAIAPSPSALKSAYYLTKVLQKNGQLIFHAAPGPNGEIMLDLRNRKNIKSLEILFYEDRAISVLFPEDGKPKQQSFDFQDLRELLQWLNQK